MMNEMTDVQPLCQNSHLGRGRVATTIMDFNVRTFSLNEHQLFNIPDMVMDCQKTFPDVKESGVMKVRLEDSIKGNGTSLETFCSFDEERLRRAQMQYAIKIPHCSGIYGVRSYRQDEFDENASENERIPACSAKDVTDFVHAIRDVRNYVTSNCCSDDAKGDADTVNHFFTEVLHEIALSRKNRASKSSVLKQGKKDAVSLKKFSKGFNTLPLHQRQTMIDSALKSDVRPSAMECWCPGCFDDGVISENSIGVMYGSGLEATVQDRIMLTKHFGLYSLASTSLLRFLPYQYPGITTPFLYFGGPLSFFPAHIEDCSMYSFNYLHFGKKKFWIVVPPNGVGKLHEAIALSTPNINQSTCENLLGHKYFVLTPQWLEERGIPFKVVVQKAGEGVIVCPNAVHFGFNDGYNVAEACNFVTKTWVPYGIVAPKCRCIGTEAHLDLERIVSAIRPDLIHYYWNQTIPIISKEEDPHFYSCILKRVRSKSPEAAVQDTISAKGSDSAIEDESDEHEQLKQENKEDDLHFPVLPSKVEGRRLLQCPKPSCIKRFLHSKGKLMIAHVEKHHSKDEDIEKYREVLQDLFRPRDKTKRRICQLCGKHIAGRAAQMKRHQESTNCRI